MRVSEGDDYDEQFPNQAALYTANINRALRGKKGQALLRELEAALLALPIPRLIEGHFAMNGQVCALGSIAVCRTMKLEGITFEQAVAKLEEIWRDGEDPEDMDQDDLSGEAVDFATDKMGIKGLLAFEIMWRNDLAASSTPEARYSYVLHWVRRQLQPAGESS